MTSIEPLYPEFKNLINNQLDFILNFAEFISGKRPSSNYTRIIAELRLFQKKLLERDSPSTTYAETIRYQNRILSIFLFTISEKIKGIIKHKKREKGTKKGKGSTKLLVPLGTWYLLVPLLIHGVQFSSKQFQKESG